LRPERTLIAPRLAAARSFGGSNETFAAGLRLLVKLLTRGTIEKDNWERPMGDEFTRRFFCRAALTLPLLLLSQRPSIIEALAACPSDGPTAQETEGPYFKPGSPERRSLLEPDIEGRRLVLSGLVTSTRCVPLRRTLLDFWQADESGRV
jgi:hypothetical protein